MKAAYLLVLLSLVSAAAVAQPSGKSGQAAGASGGLLQQSDELTPEFRNWLAANPWFGPDPQRTEFARAYAKQLMKERPGLAGRPLLDAVSRGVADKFGPAK